MAKNETRRIAPAVLAEDETTFQALQGITGYTPSNPAHTTAAASAAIEEMRHAQAAEAQASAALKTARDVAVSKEWAVHNLILGVKNQVTAQYGKDSNEAQAIGLKKSSEYKTPARKAKPNPPG